MSQAARRTIPLFLTFLVGIVLIFQWFIPTPVGSLMETMLMTFGVIISAFAVGLGIISLTLYNIDHIRKRTPRQWYFSIWALFILFLFIALGLAKTPIGQSPEYTWLFNVTFTPLSGAIYASLAFFIAAGAYRSFRARNKETAVFVIAGALLLLRNTPYTASVWSGFPIMGGWLSDVVTTSVFRGITIGLGLGSIALGIRTLMGMETGHLGRREEIRGAG